VVTTLDHVSPTLSDTSLYVKSDGVCCVIVNILVVGKAATIIELFGKVWVVRLISPAVVVIILDSITAELMADVITLVVVNASTKGALSLKDCVLNG
jgi:xanthine/uracil permease